MSNPQSLEYKFTKCSHQEEKEEALIQHSESKHAAILSPAKVTRPIPAPRRQNDNVTKRSKGTREQRKNGKNEQRNKGTKEQRN